MSAGDAAIETADIALMTDDVSKLPWPVFHAKRTLTIIRQNIVFSPAVKAVFVILTFVGMSAFGARSRRTSVPRCWLFSMP
jgi:Cd2+/Zn2+-exporting ATPase